MQINVASKSAHKTLFCKLSEIPFYCYGEIAVCDVDIAGVTVVISFIHLCVKGIQEKILSSVCVCFCGACVCAHISRLHVCFHACVTVCAGVCITNVALPFTAVGEVVLCPTGSCSQRRVAYAPD